MEKNSTIYYKPGSIWKGFSGISKLSNEANVSENNAKKWLDKDGGSWKRNFRICIINYEKKKVKIQRSEAGNHISQSFVEKLNREIGEKIFSNQYAKEIESG